MTPTLTFSVPGPVVPKHRPRFTGGYAYTDSRTRKYEQHVRVCAMQALEKWRGDHRRWNAAKRFILSISVYMPDKRKRDLDNCLKSISDALNGLLYDDDSQLDEIYAARFLDKEKPRVDVRIATLVGSEP